MKKFLFTLAALLMTTGSIYAEEYLYVEDFEVAADELGTEIDVTVKAHFDARVSAFDLEVVAPEGMVPVWSENGADCHIAYYNGRGKVAYCDASIGTLDYYNYVAITSATIVSYWQNPETGAWESALSVKWEPGDYDEMMIITFEIAEDFKGGNLTLITKPACGEDPRGNICEKGQVNERTAVVTVEGGVEPPTPTLSGEIIIGDADENGYVTVEYTGDEDVTIRVMVDGIYVPLTDGKIFLGAYGEAEVTVEVTAEGYEPMTATKIVNWEEPVLEDLTGEIVVGEPTEDGLVTVTYTGKEDVTITVNGEPYEGEIQLVEGENTLVVVVTADGYNPMEETFTVTWTAPVVLEDLTGEIIVSDPDENGFVTVTYTGDEDVTITVNGEPYEDGVQLNDGENTLVVVVSAAGYNDMEETFTVTWTAPEPPYETPAPVVTSETTDAAVIFTATGEGTVTLYIQYIDNETGDMTLETYVGEGEVSHEVARQEEATFVNVWAAAQANEEAIPGLSEVEYYVEIPALEVVPPTPEELTGEIVVGEPDENGIVTVTYTGEEEVTVTVTVNGEVVEGDVQLAEGENTIVVTVTADGYEPMEETFTVTWTPEPPQPVEGVVLVIVDQNGEEHNFDLSQGEDGDFATTVTLEYVPYGQFYWDPMLSDAENEANRPVVPFYFLIDGQRYGVEGEVATVLGFAMQNPLDAEADGFYTVPVGFSYTLGVAQKDGVYYVYAAVATPTGVDELNANKTVAGVRYFNMAGQEMQEANGMTIVVTTYTDGTTSAVKVMK